LRGSGLAGIAGIGRKRVFGCGFLVRPLLDVTRQDLAAYADDQGLEWLEDPSNQDIRFDRNFLRHEILPVLSRRWKAATSRLARSAALASEAGMLIDQLADDDLLACGFLPQAGRIEITALLGLSDARQRNMLRRALKRCALPAAPATRLQRIIEELVPAREDAQPLVRWPGVAVRRYRSGLYLQAESSVVSCAAENLLGGQSFSLELGSLGSLRLVEGGLTGIRGALLSSGLEVRFRKGGEKIRPVGHSCTHKLKKLLQQKAVVPWMRDQVPLLYAGDTLVAVADLWLAAEAAEQGGKIIEWCNHPAIF